MKIHFSVKDKTVEPILILSSPEIVLLRPFTSNAEIFTLWRQTEIRVLCTRDVKYSFHTISMDGVVQRAS